MALGTLLGGMVSYLKLAEREGFEEADKLWDNPGRWIGEGLDRSGTLTLLFEVNNTIAKVTNAPMLIEGLSALMGDDPAKGSKMEGRASRFATRNVAGALGGPTVGLLQDIVTAMDQMVRMDVKESGVNAFFRQVPGGRLPGVRTFVETQAKPFLEDTLVEKAK